MEYISRIGARIKLFINDIYHLKVLNLVSLSTQSLASCVNYFVWNCLTYFSNTKIGSVTSFSILFNFQGPVRLSLAADDLIILPQKRFFVKLFF